MIYSLKALFDCITIQYFKKRAKLQLFSEICKKNQRFLIWRVIFVCRSSLGHLSVVSRRGGEGDGNELTNEGMNELVNERVKMPQNRRAGARLEGTVRKYRMVAK